MQIPMTDKNEIKVFILYLMERIGYPMKFNDVCSVLYSENIVSFFDCGDCFTELIDAHHVTKIEQKDESGEDLYIVSPTGKKIADELSDTLSLKIRESSYRSAIRHLSFQKRGAVVECSYQEDNNGKYMVHCEIKEHSKLVLNIDVEVDSKLEAEQMMRNFRRKPEIVFRGTLALVSGEKNYIFE